MEKGTKFRIQATENYEDIKKVLKTSLTNHNNFLQKHYKLNLNQKLRIDQIFQQWLENVHFCPTKNSNYSTEEILRDIKEIHKHFVITLVDKASNNYAIICKKLYIKFLEKELQINQQNPSNLTYSLHLNENIDQILMRHLVITDSYIKRNPQIKIIENPSIPLIYGIPKMHKKEPKLRFITGASNSSIKNISLELQNILKFIKQHFERYCNAIEGRSNIRLNWIVKGSHEFIQNLDNHWLPGFNELFIADFESLFTNLPHKTVIEEISYVLKTCFKNSGPNTHYLVKKGRSFKYEQQPDTGAVSYHILEIINLLEFILGNSFAQYGQKVYKQINGIPQGNSASPLIADLTLMAMEVRYILANQQDYSKNKFIAARYMDDLFLIGSNLSKILENNKHMYHFSLKLNQTSQSKTVGDFLDITINLQNNKLITKLYNKTDDFPFKVLKFPHFDSNVHSRIICSTIAGEITRITRSCSNISDFTNRMISLMKTLVNNNFPIEFNKRQFFKCIIKYKHLRVKYNLENLDNIRKFIGDIVP